MKKIIKFIYINLIFMLCLSSTTTPYAKISLTDGNYAEKLWEINILEKNEDGFDLDKEATRLDSLIVLIRLLGLEDEVQSYSNQKCSFEDVPDWAVGYVDYAYSNGLIRGISETEFGVDEGIKLKSYITLLLRGLGYDDQAGDFTWDSAIECARSIGLVNEDEYTEVDSGNLLKSEMVKLTYMALLTKQKDADQTLGQYLVEKDKINQVVAYDIGLIDDGKVEFIDDVFERYIKDALAKEDIMYSDAVKIATIEIGDEMKVVNLNDYSSLDFDSYKIVKQVSGDNQIDTLVDLESFPNLRYFNCSVPINEVISLTNPYLAQFFVGNNSIDIQSIRSEEIKRISLYKGELINKTSFGELSNLTTLEINSLPLYGLSMIKDLDNLTSLTVNNCKLTNISHLEGLTSLWVLDLAGNSIANIDALSEITTLQYLSLQSNQISDLTPLENLTNLYRVKLYSNKVSDLTPLQNLTNISSLKLDNNQISNIDGLSSMENLNELSLGSNQLEEIEGIGSLTNLERLNLNGNNITSIEGIGDLKKLKELNLNFNQLIEVDALGELEHLTTLGLNNNNIKELTNLQNLTSLNKLVAENNKINNIEGLSESVELEELVLNNNKINDIEPLEALINLEVLFLDDNNIDDISALSGLVSLEKLYLEGNSFTDVEPLQELENLELLKLHRLARVPKLDDMMEEYVLYRREIDKIVDGIYRKGIRDYDAVKEIHDYIITNFEYDEREANGEYVPAESYRDYGILLYGKGVCSAYTDVMITLCNELDIECLWVSGTVTSDTVFGPETINHAWNMVRIEADYYHLDLTWDDIDDDDDTLIYDYFLLSDEEIASKSRIWNKNNYPVCPFIMH